jgi:hypothetical protein
LSEAGGEETTMNDKTKEPIDLQKRRTKKLRENAKREAEAKIETRWPGAKFREEAESIQLSGELLDRLKIMIRAIASKVQDAQSLSDMERSCFGLVLLLLRDTDPQAYDRLFKLITEKKDQP